MPVVLKLLFPNDIVPLESVILPSSKTRSPIFEPVSPTIIPAVFNLLSPNNISPFSSVIEPSDKVRVPIVDPEDRSVVPQINYR